MKLSTIKIYHLLFFLGMFFFPFNEYQGIPVLGEFAGESGALFLFVGFIFLVIEWAKTKKIRIPYNNFIFQLISFFLLWCILSTLINLPIVIDSYFKHTGGINRFIRQYFALLISSVIFFSLYWNVLIEMELKSILFKVRKTFLLSLIFATVYGFLETLVSYFKIGSALPILKIFDYFPFLEVSLHAEGRISSISYEPPFFAIYLITIAGWMFSYIVTEKGISKFIPTILVLILTFFSGSRTGLMVVFFQMFIFASVLYRDPEFKKYIVMSLVYFISLSSVLLLVNGNKIVKSISHKVESLDFKGNLKKNISNKSRFGMQYASLQVFKEHPLVGVGFGQQTYYSRLKYPYWATSNNYEFALWYKDKNDKTFPPGYNLYTRLLAETGIVGILLFLALMYYSIKRARQLMKYKTGDEKTLATIIYISFIGLYLNWLQIDTFRIYGLWLSLAILMRFSFNMKKHE